MFFKLNMHVILPRLCQLVYHIALSEKLNNLLVQSYISASASPENNTDINCVVQNIVEI